MSECKSVEMDMNRLLRKMRQMNNPDYLHTVSLNELFDNVYESRPSIIDGLLSLSKKVTIRWPFSRNRGGKAV